MTHNVKLCHTLATIQTKTLHTLNYALIRVIGHLKLLVMRVYNVNCPSLSQTKHMINKQHKMFQVLRGKLLGDVIIHVARKISR